MKRMYVFRRIALAIVVILAAVPPGFATHHRATVRAGPAQPPAPTTIAPPSQAPPDSGVPETADVPTITDAPKGLAVVIVATANLHVAPGARTEVIQVLRVDEHVKLLGQARGAWVRVQPLAAVVPGWIYAADLRSVVDTPAESAPDQETVAPAAATITELDPLKPEPLPPPQPRMSVVVTVDVASMSNTPNRGAIAQMPKTNRESSGIAGQRVQLVNVFGDVLAEAVTPANGQVTLTRDILPQTALFVQLPEAGLSSALDGTEVATGTVRMAISLPVLALP